MFSQSVPIEQDVAVPSESKRISHVCNSSMCSFCTRPNDASSGQRKPDAKGRCTFPRCKGHSDGSDPSFYFAWTSNVLTYPTTCFLRSFQAVIRQTLRLKTHVKFYDIGNRATRGCTKRYTKNGACSGSNSLLAAFDHSEPQP